MTQPVACPDCDSLLDESASERGDFFCPNCTVPVHARDAIYYCRECGEQAVARSNWLCPDCRGDPPDEDQDQNVDGSEGATDNDFLESVAARDCYGCGMMVIPMNLLPRPLHDGDGNYYVGHRCPHCGQILSRTRDASGKELADHAKEKAKLDPNPPDDLSDLETIEL